MPRVTPPALVASITALLATLLATLPAQAATPSPAAQAATPPASAPAVPTQPPAPIPPAASAVERLPVEAFAKLPLARGIALSPDGQHVAVIITRDNESFIATRELKAGAKLKPIYRPDEPRLRFNWVRWVNNERLLVGMRFVSEYFLRQIWFTRLISLKADGSEGHAVFPRVGGEAPQWWQDGIIDWLEGDGRHVLVQLYRPKEDAGLAVYRVDVENGDVERVQASREGVRGWITDDAHRVRAGIKVDVGNMRVGIEVCDPDGKNWRTLFVAPLYSKEEVTPLGFGKDPNHLFIAADHDGRKAVWEVDLSTPDLHRTLRLADPLRDVGGTLVRSRRTHEIVGIHDAELDTNAYWDDDYQSLARGLAKALPGRMNQLVQVTDNEERYLVYSSGNGIAPEYYVGDTRARSLDLFAPQYPQLPETVLARKTRLVLTARDGLHVPIRLTLPVGSSGRGLPAVVLPHGGPFASDGDDFDPWVQFLANRGLAVLQVDFRGSTGQGFDFMAAGYKRWGLEMQDDITDATQWLIDTGVADRKRICIVGGSYGGYAALMGAVKTPALYRCAVSLAGISDLFKFAVWTDGFGRNRGVQKLVISREGDMQQMRQTSPALLVEQIQAPVLLMHGKLDTQVDYEQSVIMADALKAAGKPYRFVSQDDGDHNLSTYRQSLEFFRELDAFLAENLGLAK